MNKKLDQILNYYDIESYSVDISKYKDYNDISFTIMFNHYGDIIDKIYKFEGYKLDKNNTIYFDDVVSNYLECSSFKYENEKGVNGSIFIDFILKLQDILDTICVFLVITNTFLLVVTNDNFYEFSYSDYIEKF
jgi:hypothetical protein